MERLLVKIVIRIDILKPGLIILWHNGNYHFARATHFLAENGHGFIDQIAHASAQMLAKWFRSGDSNHGTQLRRDWPQGFVAILFFVWRKLWNYKLRNSIFFKLTNKNKCNIGRIVKKRNFRMTISKKCLKSICFRSTKISRNSSLL